MSSYTAPFEESRCLTCPWESRKRTDIDLDRRYLSFGNRLTNLSATEALKKADEAVQMDKKESRPEADGSPSFSDDGSLLPGCLHNDICDDLGVDPFHLSRGSRAASSGCLHTLLATQRFPSRWVFS